MRNFSKFSDPNLNPAFRRSWHDEPQKAAGLQHLGREVAPKVVEDVARRAIGRWLDKASEAHGAPAAEAFQEADSIRLKMGLEWGDLIAHRSAA